MRQSQSSVVLSKEGGLTGCLIFRSCLVATTDCYWFAFVFDFFEFSNNNNNVTKQSNQWHIFWTHWRERKHNLLNPASLLSRIVTTAPPLQPCGALRTDAREMVSTHTSTTPVSPRSPKRKRDAPFEAPFLLQQWREQQCNLYGWLSWTPPRA